MRRVRGIACALALMIMLATPPAFGQADEASPAVFMLAIMETTGNGHYSHAGYATAFFISDDGTALTNSHVVYEAQHDPEHYQLLAVVGNEFYSADVVCATRLSNEYMKASTVRPGRDVAEIRLSAPRLAVDTYSYKLQTGEDITIATAHKGLLPKFAFLQLGLHAGLGDRVRVIGFGHISPLPEQWVARGQVSEMWRAWDGTEVFDVAFTGRPQAGNSGSPVLNGQNKVVGIWTWHSEAESNMGTAQSNSVLQNPCR